jgi:hypothetical protein
MHKTFTNPLFYLFVLAILFLQVACGERSTSSDYVNDDSPQTVGTTSTTNSIPAGFIEIKLPEGDVVRIPITACGGNSTMLDIQEYVRDAPGGSPYVDVVITYPRGIGVTQEGQFFINYGQAPEDPSSIWGSGTQSARFQRKADNSGSFADVILQGRSFDARWKCP